MKEELRRIHHLNAEESRMLLLFRLLPDAARASMAKIAEVQINENSQPFDNVINLASRTVA